MKGNILVIGSTNVDFIMKIPRLPHVGETITDGIFKQTYGGKGANQAVGAARAGGKVTFITCLGEDDFADKIIDNFKKDQINVDCISRIEGEVTGTALVMIGGAAENYLSVAPGSNYKISKEIISGYENLVSSSEIIIIQMEIPLESTKYILDLASKYNKRVIFNLAPALPFDDLYYSKVSILVVNEVEAETLSGITVRNNEDAKKAGKYFLLKGVQTVIITLGDQGAYYCSESGGSHVPCFKVDAVDSTAAGDTFCGSLAVALVEGMDWPGAIRFASAASAITVTRFGAQPSIPLRNEIDAFLLEREAELAV